MRPRVIAEFIGQEHLLGPERMLRSMIERDALTSLIFWGPPGCGKTTLAHVIAAETSSRFVFFSAILSGVKELREIFKEAELQGHRGKRTLLFVDEIHRFNKSQQDALLPYVEKGVVTMIGATTENPSFEIISPLLSRCRVLTLQALTEEHLRIITTQALHDRDRGLGERDLTIADDAINLLVEMGHGDARTTLNSLETAAGLAQNGHICAATVLEALQHRPLSYDKNGEEHYNVISAFIKSIRGSDPDGALYWGARMLEAGEDPLFILRRLIIVAAEDIGNADPRALQMATAALQGFQFVGMPEGRIILGQVITYLATAPKSNAAYVAMDKALAEVRASGTLPVPLHLRNAPTKLMKELGYHQGYAYAHDHPEGYIPQQYLPDRLVDRIFYSPTGHGYEKSIRERMEWWNQRKKGTDQT